MTSSVILSALFAGLIAVAASVAVERFGGRFGGLLGSIPTTIVPFAVGTWTSAASGAEAADVYNSVPPGMMVTAVFLYCWRVMPPKLPQSSLQVRLFLMTIGALGVWFVVACTAVLFMASDTLPLYILGPACFAVQLVFGVYACAKNPPSPKGHNPVNIGVLVARGGLAAIAIGIAVWFASLGYPLLAGVASVFPAIFLTTMISVWLSQGQAVQAGAVGPMMLGSTSVSAFALFAVFAYPLFGPTLGSVLAWFGSVLAISVPAWVWMGRQDKTT